MREPIFKPEDVINIYSILHNFDVSIVMPYYKKLDEMRGVLSVNAPFFNETVLRLF